MLDETYGVITYQDQVLEIARTFAGYTLGQADIMRKAMGKKIAAVMLAERERFVSGAVEKGYDPRDFAVMGFGGAGPLHVNAVAKLMGSWPAVSPVSPGVLCALGDATTRMRTETARSFSRLASQTEAADLIAILEEMAAQTRAELLADGVPEDEISTAFEVDVRYAGQAFEVPLTITPDVLTTDGIAGILARFDAEHKRLFTFNMDTPHEIVNLRAVVVGDTVFVSGTTGFVTAMKNAGSITNN